MSSDSASLNLQERDLAFLAGLFEARIITLDHASRIFFEGKHSYAKKRVQRIKAAGLIAERNRRMNEPAVLFLTRKGFEILKIHDRLSEYPQLVTSAFITRANVSQLTLCHEIEIMDVKSAFHASLSTSHKYKLLEFTTWPLLYQFETVHPQNGRPILMKPDGFVSIYEKEEMTKGFAHDCFLEVDRSSEVLDVLVTKSACYLDYYKSGGFAVRNGANATEFKDFPFRVLIVMKSAERRNNAAERLAQNNPPVLTHTWLTTFAEVTTKPLDPIWILPKDYREVAYATPYYRETPTRSFQYRRQTQREEFIESKIKKRSLLEG